jgi:hypothetical protein
VHALLQRRGCDLRGRQADALVDDVHAGVAGPHGDLLGAVGVPVQARLADQDLQPPAERLGDPVDLVAAAPRGGRPRLRQSPPHAGGRAVGTEDLAQRLRPLAGGTAGAGCGDRRRHDVLVLLARHARELGQRRVDRALVARLAPAAQVGDLLGLDLGVDDENAALDVGGKRRGLGLGVLVDPDDDLLALLDAAHALAVGVDQRRLHVRHRLDGAAVLLDHRHLRAGPLDELGDEAIHHLGALEDVGVLEQVGLVGEHLLDAQGPLLVPGPRQAERLVPGRELDRAGAGAAAERDRERL